MIEIEEKEPKVFDNEPKEITIDDAKRYYNAKYLNNGEVYDTDIEDVIKAGVKGFAGSLKKLPTELRMAGGQALYASGEQMKENAEYRAAVYPKGNMIFNGNLGVKLGDKLMESGKYNIITANRNLETLNREIEADMPHLSAEDRNSWTMMIAEQGLDYGVMLGLSYINPVLGMGYMGTKIFGQETEEGAEAYKKKFGTIEGFEKLSGDELTLNVGNVAVQEVFERAFGAPAQLKRFKTMKDFSRAFFAGFGEESLTENLQNVSDAVFDHIGKRLEEDETIFTRIQDNFKGTLVAGLFGGTAGTAFAISNRAKGISDFEQLLEGSDVPVEDRNTLATDLYESGVNNLQEIVTKELELNSQLRAKHGQLYDNLKKQIDRQVRATGAFQGKSESEIAQYLEGTAKQFADNVLAEAQLRNSLIDDVVNKNDIVYEKGRLRLAPKLTSPRERAYNPERMSLLTYLKYKGGLKDVGGDLKAMDAGKQVIGLINNKSGRSLDDAAMDAWESGYFPQFPERPSVNDLLNAISDSLGGRKIYRESYRQTIKQKEDRNKATIAQGELDDFLSDFFSQEDIDSMSQDDKQRFYSEIQEQSNAVSEDEYIDQEYNALTEDEQERYSMMRENGASHEDAIDEIRARRDPYDAVERRHKLQEAIEKQKQAYADFEAGKISMEELNKADEELEKANREFYGDGLFDLYQESMDVAEENARLDEMYPAYEGETININGQEKTVYNSNGDRIAKSKEALENFYKWFGDSKVVDEQGRPKAMYHGTRQQDIQEFKSPYGDKLIFFAYKKEFAEDWSRNAKMTEGQEREWRDFLNSEEYRNFRIKTQEEYKKKYGAEWWKNDSYANEARDKVKEFENEKQKQIGILPKVMEVYLKAESTFNPVDDYELVLPEIAKHFDMTLEELQNDEGKMDRIKKGAWIFFENKEVTERLRELGFDSVSLSEIAEQGISTLAVFQDNNQIKSTSNRGTYSESENIYYQFAGERAKTAALDELNRAKQLESDGVDNEEIRQQTGWFKGADNIWRFEISDKDAKFKDVSKMKFQKTANANADIVYRIKLGDLLEHEKLYQAYPFLRDIEVIATDEKIPSRVYLGLAYPDKIFLNSTSIENQSKGRKVLLHEIQHLIQTYEGFAQGGGPGEASDIKETIKNTVEEKSKQYVRNKLDELVGRDASSDIMVNHRIYVEFSRDSLKAQLNAEDDEKINELIRRTKEAGQDFEESLQKAGITREQFDKIQNEARNLQDWTKLRKVQPLSDYEIYERIAGEVEARNVEKRADMADEQRRAESPESTQDVANADAIVIFDDGTAMAYEPETYYQSAFAGSRVDYDRPSLEAIGSGEGNQAHGWGLYYALNKDVAEGYRENYEPHEQISYDGKFIIDLHNTDGRILEKLANKEITKEQAIKEYKSIIKDVGRNEDTDFRLNRLENIDVSKFKKEKGQVHEVDIPENPYLLDEQKPFSEQSEHVRGVLESLNKDGEAKGFLDTLRTHKDDNTIDGYDIYQKVSKYVGGDKAASQLLEKLGIKGITYDGRRDGRCFVIFNPDDVKVIQKFYQKTPQKKIKGAFDKLTKSIKITKDADFSTYQHEFAHFWLDNIWDYVNSGQASADYLKRFDAIKKWLDVKPNQSYFTRAQHEKFARGYEKFLYQGKAVNPIIASAFDDYEKFIRDVYDDITEIDTRADEKYEPLTREAYNFFNSMVSGELTPPANLPDETIEQARQTVEKSETDAKEVVVEESKVLEENRANYKLEPVKTDTKTSYLSAYEKMTGEKVEAGVAELDKEMAKANEFVANNLELAEKIVNGEAPTPENMLKNTIYLAYQDMQKKLGNTEKRANALLNQAQELRAYGQEIASQKLAYADQSTPLYWLSRVMSARAESIAEGNKMTVSELQDYINNEIKGTEGDEKAVDKAVKTLAENLGIRELYQTEKVDLSTKDGVYKYVTSKLGITPTQEQTAEIVKRADDMLNNLNNAQTNGNPTVDYFVKYKDLENYANSIAPSSNLRVLVSVVGKSNLMTSFKSPLTNVAGNTPVAGLQAALRRQHLGVMKSIVDPELIKQNKKLSWEIYRKTGYQLNNMTDVSPKGLTLGEKITHSQGEGNIRKIGRIYENLIYKWSLGAPDLLFKDFAFNDYVSLAATKESGGDVAKANEIYKDAVKILPKTELGQRIRQEAIEDSLVSTYQNNGKISESALKIRKSLDFRIGFGEFIAPFVKTPANVVGMGLDTAFGGVRALTSEIIRDVKAGKVLTPKSENVRLVVQNGLGLLVASLLLGAIDDDDYMPSYALATNKDKQLAKELNIPYNSIRIGDTWYSMDYLGPLASPVMGLLQARREDGIINSVMGYVKSGAIQTLSIPAFGNVGDLNEKIQNVVRKDGVDALEDIGSQVIEATVARSVPSIVSDIAKVLDENDREAKTLKEKLQAKTPILREKLPEKYNVTTGKVMPRSENTIKRVLIDLFAGARVKEQVVNDMADELFRLNSKGYGVGLTDITRSGLLSTVDSDKKALVKKDFAQMYSKGVQDLIKTYRYRHADDEDKKDMIDSLRRKYVNELKKKYLKKSKR